MRPKGIVQLFDRDRLVWKCENIFVNSGLPTLAHLIAGATTGQSVVAIGFGSGGTAPTAADSGLTAQPAYYNPIESYTFPSLNSVQFNYALQSVDYAASGITIQELGLFANAAAAVLPAAVGTTLPNWGALTALLAGALLLDANGNTQLCTTPGTTGNTPPAWATALNSPTADGSVSWSLVALHTPPSPMIAHVAVPAFAYTGTGNYAGNWTLTF